MSLIAATFNDTFGDGLIYPIIIGDVLFTSKQGSNEMPLPTFFDGLGEFIQDSVDYLPIGLGQKVYVIAENLVISMAGYGSQMVTLLDAIKNHFKHYECNESNLQKFFDGFSVNSNYNGSSFIILMVTQSGRVLRLHYGPVTESMTPNFGTVFSSGSGSEEFIDKVETSAPHSFSPGQNGITLALSRNLNLLGRLITFEKTHLITILNYWGVAYEVVFLNNNKFQKLNDITNIILSGTLDLDTGVYKVTPVLCTTISITMTFFL